MAYPNTSKHSRPTVEALLQTGFLDNSINFADVMAFFFFFKHVLHIFRIFPQIYTPKFFFFFFFKFCIRCFCIARFSLFFFKLRSGIFHLGPGSIKLRHGPVHFKKRYLQRSDGALELQQRIDVLFRVMPFKRLTNDKRLKPTRTLCNSFQSPILHETSSSFFRRINREQSAHSLGHTFRVSSQGCSETLTSFQPGAEHPAIMLDHVHVISLLRVRGSLGPEGASDSCGSRRGQRPAVFFPRSCQVGTTSFGWQRDTPACEVACEWQGLPLEGKTKCKSSPVTSQTRRTRFRYGKSCKGGTSVV